MFIFAHRGMKSEMPENTMPAFKEAFSLGFGVEFDVRMTMDKKAVVIHDKDLWRIAGKHVNISAMTLAELRMLDIGSHFNARFLGTRIPTLEEVCELIINDLPIGQRVAIHLKYEEQMGEMLWLMPHIFENYDLYEKAFIFDLTFLNAKNFKKIAPRIPIALSVGENNYSPTIYRWEEIISAIDNFDYIWLDEWKVQGGVLNKALIDEIHKSGKKICAVSPELHKEHGHPQSEIGYKNTWKNLNKWGIDGICTAYPDKLKTILISEALLIDKDYFIKYGKKN